MSVDQNDSEGFAEAADEMMMGLGSDGDKTFKRPTFGLWFLALVLMFAAYAYQKRTGPTYPKRGAIEVAGEEHEYRLIRSEETVRDAEVILPAVGEKVSATLVWRRYPTQDEWARVAMAKETRDEEPVLLAKLPAQPAAGKIEYFLEADVAGKPVRIPAESDDDLIIRFKDPVPSWILWPHIICMFTTLFFGLRAGLGAIFNPVGMRKLVWTTLGVMTFGGLVLGPIVQKYAFGHYWTGFPYGKDLTDNKLLILWVLWVIAALVVGFKPKKKEGPARFVVAACAIVAMTVVYLIPHSMRGSELDYSKLEGVENPKDAIGTGKK